MLLASSSSANDVEQAEHAKGDENNPDHYVHNSAHPDFPTGYLAMEVSALPVGILSRLPVIGQDQIDTKRNYQDIDQIVSHNSFSKLQLD